MRFGRSSTPTDDDAEEISLPDEITGKPQEDLHRLGRAKDNFIRFGRSDESDKDLDNFLRTERARQDNFIRFGRGRDVQNFIRFGRGRDNFMRFGRGRNDNFMRFGKSHEDGSSEEDFGTQKTIRSGGSKSTSNFMRFGRDDIDDNSDELNSPVDRSSRGKTNNNFLRFGRGKQDSGFIRFGRNGADRNFMRFGRDGDTDHLNRFSRPFQDKHNGGFIRFGRSDKGKVDHDVQRTKRSLLLAKNEDDLPLYQIFKDFPIEESDSETNFHVLPYDLDEEYEGTARHQEVWSRKKRSTDDSTSEKKPTFENEIPDSFPQQLHFKPSPLHYYPYPLSAGLPNFIVGPEFSLLPPLDISSSKLKRGKTGDRNFIRLG